VSRDDRDQIIAALERELHRLRCEYRRVCEESDWKAEEVRVLRRVIAKLIDKENPPCSEP
jgi:ribosomal protein L29